METRNYWEGNGHAVKYDNYNLKDSFSRVDSASDQLNFSATVPSDDEAEYPAGSYLKKGKVSRQDPMSHRIIEKRRRDRMNNCLADLSRLIPPEYLKKGRGRVEKTEIIEMAIRHLKFLQERADGLYLGTKGKPNHVNGRRVGVGEFKAGYHAAAGEAVRFLVEVQGYVPGDGLCVQMAAHLQRHCEILTNGEVAPREKLMSLPSLTSHSYSHQGSSSETTSSSGSSHGHGYAPPKAAVIAKGPPPPAPPALPPPYSAEPCEPDLLLEPYPMECDRLSLSQLPPAQQGFYPDEPLPLDGRREPAPRSMRKPDHAEDYLQSYKFKNCIERRFSRSQDNEAADMLARTAHAHCKVYSSKRRRAAMLSPSTSTSASGSTEETQDTSPQDTSSESPGHQHYEKLPASPATQYVPVFALNTLGKYYVPLSVDYACLARHLGPYDVLDARAVQLAAPLHPVTIHVNFQPYLKYHVKREPAERSQEV